MQAHVAQGERQQHSILLKRLVAVEHGRVQRGVQQGGMNAEAPDLLGLSFLERNFGEKLPVPPPCRRDALKRRSVLQSNQRQLLIEGSHVELLGVLGWPSLLVQAL